MTEKAAATEGEPQHRRMQQRVVEPVQRCSVTVSKLAVDVGPLIRSQGDPQLTVDPPVNKAAVGFDHQRVLA